MARGATALMAAVEAGNGRIAELLLKGGANPNLQGTDGQTAAAIARRRGDDSMAGLLVRYGGR